MPYTADKPQPPRTSAQLRAEIPGWGVDLDLADRPSVPRETDVDATQWGAHWELPERQPELVPRERSIEHAMLTPCFGTAQPLHGLSGAIRRHAYARYSEARLAHWLLLVAGDRVEVAGSVLRSLLTTRPDNPLTQTGVLAELRHHPVASRRGGRIDGVHQALDPLVNAAPWVLGAGAAVVGARRALRRT